jgi:hypothetical protein
MIMDVKIILETTEQETKVQFEPTLDSETFVPILNSALNAMPGALMAVFSKVPMLRPACLKEQENNMYVFQTDDKGKMENDLYKYRKGIYDATVAIFSQLLSAAFPDIEYIERCKAVQQEYCATHTEEEVKAYKENIESVVAYVRDNFEEILEELLAHEQEKKED